MIHRRDIGWKFDGEEEWEKIWGLEQYRKTSKREVQDQNR